ncbi:MAG: GFA family protein [Pseudomonadota bacterium]
MVTGGCLCGAIRYNLAQTNLRALHCHCQTCRKQSGAIAVTWIEALFENFTITQGVLCWYSASSHARRGFCQNCGSILIYDAIINNVRDHGVSIGSLDDSSTVAVSGHIWCSQQLGQFNLDPHLPSFAKETDALLCDTRHKV